MGIISIDEIKKKQAEEKKKKQILKQTKRATPGADILEIGWSAAERNASVGYSPELDKIAAKGEMETLVNNLDVSALNHRGTNNQREVLKNIQTDLEQEHYFSALARIIREDVQLTNRTLWTFLRLNRVYQGQRSGTTDVEEMPEMREQLSDSQIRDELMGQYGGPDKNKPAVEMALRTVANGRSGTTTVGLEDLELASELVRNILKGEITAKYEDVASLEGAQHGLSGLEAPGVRDMNPIRGSYSNNEKINKYLRLYEVLTIELLNKQKYTEQKDSDLKFTKALSASLITKLSNFPGVAISAEMQNQFKNKIAQLETLGQLEFFNFKVSDLVRRLKSTDGENTAQEANAEIRHWLDPGVKFTHREELEDIQKRKDENKKRDQEALKNLRSREAA